MIVKGRCIVCGLEDPCDVDSSAVRSHDDGAFTANDGSPLWVHGDGRVATVCNEHDPETVRAAYVLAERTLREVERTDLENLVTERA
jgi:hypothetical protein